MTGTEIPPIVLLIDPHRDSLERYSRLFEDEGLWVAAATAYDELLPTAEELRPDIVIADMDTDTDTDTDGRRRAALDAVKHDPGLAGVPLIVLVPPRTDSAPDADVTLTKPVVPEFLLRRAREVLSRGRALRGHSNTVIDKSHVLMKRSSQLADQAAGIAAGVDERCFCPNCSAALDWVERGTVGGISYDYFRWCPRGCGLFCLNRDSQQWLKLA